eukprot:scaffold34586_cov57-Phaeocystis_antarctica.AAC.2
MSAPPCQKPNTSSRPGNARANWSTCCARKGPWGPMRHLLFVAALSSTDTVRATSAPPPPSSSSATSAQSVALGVSVPREHRGRLLAHGTACPDWPDHGCIGYAQNDQATCCRECKKGGGT